jgi:hypothetical protein
MSGYVRLCPVMSGYVRLCPVCPVWAHLVYFQMLNKKQGFKQNFEQISSNISQRSWFGRQFWIKWPQNRPHSLSKWKIPTPNSQNRESNNIINRLIITSNIYLLYPSLFTSEMSGIVTFILCFAWFSRSTTPSTHQEMSLNTSERWPRKLKMEARGHQTVAKGHQMEAKEHQWRSHVTNLAATGRAVAPPNVITFLVLYQHKTIYVAYCK